MFKNIKKTLQVIKKTLGYDPQQNVGKFGSTGSNIDNKEQESEPNGYNANEKVLNVHPDGGVNIDLDARTTMKYVQDFHTNAVFDLLGQPQTARPQKNAHRDVDAQLAAQYYGNMK